MITRSARRRVLAWVPAAILLFSLSPLAVARPALAGESPKPFAATVFPSTAVAGATAPMTLTITNDSHAQSLGSANLIGASGFSYQGTDPHPLLNGDPGSPIGDAALVGDALELRNLSLPPGAFLTLAFVAQAPCGAGTDTWAIAAKQSNDFNGTGNDFALEPPPATQLDTAVTGACELRFVRQPAETQVGAGITDGAIQTGAPIQIAVQTQAGAVVTASSAPIALAIGTVPPGGTATLGGTTLVDAVAGVATFCDPVIDPGCSLPSIGSHGLGYTLTASTDGIVAGGSAPFDVLDGGAVCPAGPCHAGASMGNTGGGDTVTAAAGDVVAVSIGVDSLTCVGYTNTSQVVTFSSTANSVNTATITIAAGSVTKPAARFQICFGSSLAFTDRKGHVVPAGGAGLLADCSKKVAAPCTSSRLLDKATGDVILIFLAPAGDPKGVG